jgi:hypothetical protein
MEKVFFLTVVQIRLHNREVETTKMRPAVVRGLRKVKKPRHSTFCFFKQKSFFFFGKMWQPLEPVLQLL